ncbi:MAG: hypothetical protein U9N77_11375 [Thermodesulfobacteriota bacterium]|nr:hypothetical protein [Thermodesulfobacteriota bacterium]
MKKLFIIFIAMAAVFVMAGSAAADDRLELSGQFYVRAYSMDGYGNDNMWSATYDDDDDLDFIRQKFLLGIKANVADDVYAKLRVDYGEAKWGYDYSRGAVAKANDGGNVTDTAFNLERAYINIDKENWSLRLGQQFLALGIMEVFDGNPTAANLGLKFDPVTVNLIYAKLDEGDSISDDGDANDDKDFYAVNVSYDVDAYSSNFFACMASDGSDNDDSPFGIGLNVKGTAGIVNLNTELAYLGGDTNDGDTDYEGIQFYLSADANVTDMINIGAEFLWADASDDDEIQLTNLGNWDDFSPDSSNTPVWTYVSNLNWAPFDPSGASAGVIGAFLSVDVNIMDGLKAGSKIGYLEPEDDGKVGCNLDSIVSFNAFFLYRIATNTDFSVTYFQSSPDYDDNSPDDSTDVVVAQLELNF